MEYNNRFTDNLQSVISIAEEAAKIYGSSYIGSEHIVFAMLNCTECTAYKVLVSCEVSTKHMIERALELSIDLNGEDSLAGT